MKAPLRSLRPMALVPALFVALAATAAVPAAETDPKARQALDEVARAYQHLSKYMDQGEFVLSATVNGKHESLRTPMALSFERPNRLKLDTGEVMLVSDGTTMTTMVQPLKKYAATAAPKSIEFETFRQGPLGSMLFGGPSAMPMYILLNMVAGNDPEKAISKLGGALVLEADRDASGVPCKTVRIDQQQGPDIRLSIDPQTKLLRAVDLVLDAKEMADKGLNDKVSLDRLGWSSGTINTKELPSDVFAFQAPKNYEKVESFARAAEEAKYPVNDLVGKPAPGFTLTVLDGPDKTRTLSNKDLAGKVVMIDFWATWCGPCMMELPEVQKVIEQYAKDKKDVVIVALSQDDEPKELGEVRKLVEKTLENKQLKLTGTPVGLIGLDPSHSVGDAFQVNAYPTVVLIDAKGVIQAAHVGIPGGEVETVAKTLTDDINTLLEGKSLVGAEKPAEAAAK